MLECEMGLDNKEAVCNKKAANFKENLGKIITDYKTFQSIIMNCKWF